MKKRREAPWKAGLRAARANVVPGLLVQGAMLAVLVAYFASGAVRDFLARVAEVKAAWGFGYSFLAAVVAGALIPELLRLLVFQRGKWTPANARNLGFAIPFWGSMGVVVDLLYRGQARWFGDEATWQVVVPQVLVDQFVYNPLFAAPVTVWAYEWRRARFRLRREWFTAEFYRDRVVPTLFATWGVWIPVVTVLYLLPEPVQIPLFALALSLWVMLYSWMSENSGDGSELDRPEQAATAGG